MNGGWGMWSEEMILAIAFMTDLMLNQLSFEATHWQEQGQLQVHMFS